jgi:serine/threonine protein kinase
VSLPARLGRLQRVNRIGVGGFATVWLYHDDELDSDVAVKALADNWAQRFDVRERFLEEARILRRADSDHVVRVYDIGEADGTPYFVMSYADLGSLASLVEPAGRSVPVLRAVDLVEQAGTGLAVLHRQGVIHRDIKPQNLLLRSVGSEHERVLVADLGVAKAMIHASGLTQVVGTPAYMAPEQATGEGIDVRADVHALGAVAYQLLTGQLVRKGGLADLMDARLPHKPSAIAELPSSVDDVLLRALHPDREQRWPDVVSFTQALRRAVTEPEPTVLRESVTTLAPPTVATLPTVEPAEPAAASGGRWLLVLVCLLVLFGTFAASYALTSQLR